MKRKPTPKRKVYPRVMIPGTRSKDLAYFVMYPANSIAHALDLEHRIASRSSLGAAGYGGPAKDGRGLVVTGIPILGERELMLAIEVKGHTPLTRLADLAPLTQTPDAPKMNRATAESLVGAASAHKLSGHDAKAMALGYLAAAAAVLHTEGSARDEFMRWAGEAYSAMVAGSAAKGEA